MAEKHIATGDISREGKKTSILLVFKHYIIQLTQIKLKNTDYYWPC